MANVIAHGLVSGQSSICADGSLKGTGPQRRLV